MVLRGGAGTGTHRKYALVHFQDRAATGVSGGVDKQPGGALATLPRALHTKRSLALAGRFFTSCDSVLGTLGYTLEPYVERAWPSSGHLRFVTLAATRDLEDVRGELRRSVLGPDLPPDFEGKELDQMVNDSAEEVDTTIVVLVAAGADTGGLPDPGLLRDLQALQACAN